MAPRRNVARAVRVSTKHLKHLRRYLGLPIALDHTGLLRGQIHVRLLLGTKRQLYATTVLVGSGVRIHDVFAYGKIAERFKRYNQLLAQLRDLQARFASVTNSTALKRGSEMWSAHHAFETLERNIAQRQDRAMGTHVVDVRTLAFEFGFLEGLHEHLADMTARAEELARMHACGEDTLDLAPVAPGSGAAGSTVIDDAKVPR